MGQSLLLHKRADYSGSEPPEGEAWPLSHVELQSEPPAEHRFSEEFVDQNTKLGWIEYAGEPLSYEVYPDPEGPLKHASSMTMKLPGDRLVLRVTKDGEPIQVVYRITHPPVPRNFRMEDSREPDGIRAAREFGVQLEA
jgi:hypothetical protein